MSMLSGQIDELRLMGDGQAAKGEFTVATLLREAADTIESLRERLQDGTCEFELNTDMTAIRCDNCGYELPKGTDLKATRFCGGCGRMAR